MMKTRTWPGQLPIARRWEHLLLLALVVWMVLGAQRSHAGSPGAQDFTGRIDLDGDISDFLDANGAPLPGVCVQEDPDAAACSLPCLPPEVSFGLGDEASSRLLSRDSNLHPSGFNLRRIFAAYNPHLDNGTLYIGLDLPGGSGTVGNPFFNNMDYGSVITRGQVRPFDADGNGEPDFIGRTCETDLSTGFSSCLEGNGCPDVWSCNQGSGAFTAGDNPRGGWMASLELYQTRVTFGGGETITLAFLQDYLTAPGLTDLLIFDNDLPFEARVSTDTGSSGVPKGFDVEFAISQVNLAVAQEIHRRVRGIEVMTGFTGGPGGGDYIAIEPVPALSISHSGQDLTITWEPEIPGYHLERADDLVHSDWRDVPGDGHAPVNLPASGTVGIFRLTKD